MAIKVWGAGSTQGSDQNWNTASNWDDDTLPVDGDSILFDGTTTNSLLSGPTSSSIIIENITVTSDAPYIAISGTFPLIVTGQLNSASPNQIYVTIYPYGITSVVGMWVGDIRFPTDKPVDSSATAYLGISEVLFTPSNYLEFGNFGYGNISELKYGISDVLLNVSGQAPFTSFKLSSTGTSSGTGFNMSAIVSIYSQLIEFDNILLQLFNGSMLELDAPLINITHIGALYNYTGGGGFGPPTLIFPQACTISISSDNSLYYPIPVNDNLILNFYQPSIINLYGEATIYGTSSAGFMSSLSSTMLLQGTTTINAYDNSLVAGIYNGGSFSSGNLENNFYYPCTVNMRDNSVFLGMIIGGVMGSGITFFDSSNVSFAYTYDKANSQIQAYTSSTPVGGGDIPQTQTGLTIFKSSF